MTTLRDRAASWRRPRQPVAAVLRPTLAAALPERSFRLRFWDGSALPPTRGGGDPPVIVVRSPRALARLLRTPGELGLARAYVAGELDLDGDLEALVAARDELRVRPLSRSDRLRALRAAARVGALGLHAPAPPASEAHVTGRRRSRARDAAAVRHHYDVPEAFYRLVLGPTMVYSCAVFAHPDEDLDAAQERKLERLCRKLRLRPGERLLDVGCGWGSLVLHAAAHHGVRAVGVTLSPPQAETARARVRAAGLEDRCEIRVADYREVDDGPYDKVVSVGMYEHVGRDQLPVYAGRLAALVRPGGLVLNHGITKLRPGVDDPDTFIARYVFPDGQLHPLTDLLVALEAAGLELRDVESLREHYGLTLRAWTRNLARHREAAIAAAGEERERIWRLYMSGSALAFERGDVSVFQTLAARPGAPHGLPLGRPEGE
jgi:cyclopropane-fatty-acyl-phospholipid synthase